MISGYHSEVSAHYEKYPYPAYPIFAKASWKSLASVNCETWGATRNIRDIWIVGCGTIAPLMFARRNFKARVLATDLSEASLSQAARRVKLFGMRNLILKKEDLFEAKYEEAFDAIDAYGVIHHTVSPKRSVEILLRALRNGGVLRLMVYSKDARSEIEDLRKEVQSLGIKDLARVKEIVGEKGTRLLGDLSEPSGMADALLNPIAHTFTRETLDELLQSFLNLEVLKIEAGGNFVVHARKRS